jgi:hypothetical protein
LPFRLVLLQISSKSGESIGRDYADLFPESTEVALRIASENRMRIEDDVVGGFPVQQPRKKVVAVRITVLRKARPVPHHALAQLMLDGAERRRRHVMTEDVLDLTGMERTGTGASYS